MHPFTCYGQYNQQNSDGEKGWPPLILRIILGVWVAWESTKGEEVSLPLYSRFPLTLFPSYQLLACAGTGMCHS